jgi:hypothetical protein
VSKGHRESSRSPHNYQKLRHFHPDCCRIRGAVFVAIDAPEFLVPAWPWWALPEPVFVRKRCVFLWLTQDVHSLRVAVMHGG